MQRAGGVHYLILVMHQMTTVMELVAIHTAIGAFRILGEFIVQWIWIGWGLGGELQRSPVLFTRGSQHGRTQSRSASGSARYGEPAEQVATFKIKRIAHEFHLLYRRIDREVGAAPTEHDGKTIAVERLGSGCGKLSQSL